MPESDHHPEPRGSESTLAHFPGGTASRRIATALAGVGSFTVFALTAFPSITWWDSSNYSLAAATLGITTPPGSLLLTLVGWLVTRLPWPASPARVLNLTAAALAAVIIALVVALALRLLRHSRAPHAAPGTAGLIGVTVGVAAFAVTPTLWRHAVKFTPYILTPLLTCVIVWNMLRWWEEADDPAAWRRLLMTGLLFGLDVSVHRTNLLLLPGLFVWIVFRRPRTLREARSWAAGAAGVAAGLSLQLALMPLAATDPLLNAGDPETWRRFYDYVSLAQYGGGFLVQFYPRHAPLWSVQAADLGHQFAANFAWGRGWTLLPGLLPLVLGAAGFVAVARRDRRLGVALVALFVVQAAMTVLYFNIPANFFRPFDRHYLPVFTLFAMMMAVGAGDLACRLAGGALAAPSRSRVAAAFLLAVVPASLFIHNFRATDASRRHFARDFASNLLTSLPRNAVLFTSGDNDTFPLLYLQGAEQVRTDVQIVNLALANTDWYMRQITARDSTFPLRADDLPDAGVLPWPDSTVTIPVEGTPAGFGLPPDAELPDSIALRTAPTMGGRFILRQDLVLLRVLTENRWRRPVCFTGFSTTAALQWLAPWRRLDGLFWCVVPYEHPPLDRGVLQRTLLEQFSYRGYADPGLPLDDFARTVGRAYRTAFLALAQAQVAAGDEAACRTTRARMLDALPLARLDAGEDARATIARLCQPAAAAAAR